MIIKSILRISMTHIRFDEDNALGGMDVADVGVTPTHAAASSSGGLLTPHCCGSMKVDNSTKDPAYVFQVVSNSSGQIAASTSSQLVQVYTAEGSRLAHAGTLQGHTDALTGIQYAPGNPYLMYSSSRDGTVQGWDTRTGQQIQMFQAPGHELLCLSAQDQVLAAGGQGAVLFWDRRNGQLMNTMDDTHMEDVTQVKFCPNNPQTIFSTSVDGLVAVHDTRKPLTDDDAFIAAVNVDNSVEEIGFYGMQNERLWIRTGTETLHLWEWARAASEELQGGEGVFANFADLREQATQVAINTSNPALQQAFQEGVQYLAGCHYDQANQKLYVMGGQEGSLGFWPLQEQACPTTGVLTGASVDPPIMLLSGAHTSVVRSALCVGSAAQGVCFVTGGEDAQICLWSLDPTLPPQGSSSPQVQASMNVQQISKSKSGGHAGGGRHHKAGGHTKRMSPY